QTIMASVHDITRRKDDHRKLQRTKDFTEWLIDNASVIVLGLDHQGLVIQFNQAAEQVTGYSRDEVLGKNWFDLVLPRDRYPQYRSEFEQLDSPGKIPTYFENPILTKSGEERLVAWHNSFVNVPDSPIALFSFGEDITEKRLAEENNRRNKQFFETLFKISPAAIVVLDNGLNISSCNPTFEELFGWKQEEILGTSLDELVNTEETLKSGKLISRNVIEGNTQHGIYQRKKKDGSLFDVEVFGVPVILDGERIGVLAIYHDVSELEKARREAESANQAKSAFLATMSHEIRTPMNAVIGMTSLLLDTPLNEEQKDFVETVRTSGDTLLSLINDILDFSKIESGRMELELHPFEIQACLEEAMDLVAMRASEKKLDLILLMDEHVPGMVNGDVTRLRQIIVNLLGNAVKFTQQGEVVLEVKPSDNVEDVPEGMTRLVFSVRDTGIGIPPEKMDRLFKSFSQVDSSTTRHYGGTGLGLAISKRLAEMMGGTMWVESTAGVGSTFLFTVLAQEATDIPRPHRALVDVNLSEKRILLVDDNPTNRKLLTLQTRSWCMQPVAAESGKEALAILASQEKFDLAVLDMQMPEMDGIELAERIRALPGFADLPMVMLTSLGYRDPRATQELFAAFLNKPIKTSQLFNVLVSVLAPIETKKLKTQDLKLSIDPEMGVRLPLHILIAEDNPVNQKVA
ncbi:MAG: PAS domain S-box protein, partial [Anaerolineaceae bacterium]|nr:PAS domain S-box protein [Anaerolineaceae bacterium]